MVNRSAGILLHPTSLPGKFGIGDLGSEAYNFINFLAAAGQTLWQIFPLGPTGYGDSPYQTFSAFAGNPLLISPELLQKDNLLAYDDLKDIPEWDAKNIDFGKVIDYKYSILKKAYENFKRTDDKHIINEFMRFVNHSKEWLEDYALFMAIKDYHNGDEWLKWPSAIALREPKAIEEWTLKLSDSINFRRFIQYEFFKQWKALKNYAAGKKIKIIGDIPIFIAYDSVDLWANKHLFSVDKNGKLEFVAGVPPDYFSETGQLWGNPLYKWNEMEKDDFLWWRKRIHQMLELVDIIRIDHFRGFDAYWEIPGNAKTAVKGRWVKAPGEKLFNSIKKHMGDVNIIAEDLGVITKEVEHLRDKFGFPGIKILQFAFGKDMEQKFLPHNHIKNCIVHTGSHDNDTTRAYFEKAKIDGTDIYEFTQKYLNYYGDDLTQQLIRVAYSSVANIIVIPMQDVLNLGGEARMNYPGKLGGNWVWRFTWDQVPYDLASRYKEMTILYERPPLPKKDTIINTES